MATGKSLQAIAGVSASRESVVLIVYPSVASTKLGRLLGSLYNCIPLKINGIKLSHLLFTWPTTPIPLAIYLALKIAGRRYVVTNRSVQIRSALTDHLLQQVPLSEIAEITITQRSGQAFYRAANISLVGSDGTELMRLDGVPRPEIFRYKVLEARDARLRVEASLATIQARHSG